MTSKCHWCGAGVRQKTRGVAKQRCDNCDIIYRSAYLAGYNSAQRRYKDKLIALMSEKLCWCKT